MFIDLTKAFDTVDHNTLLYKLDHYGIRGHAHKFCKSYLYKRQQYVVINGIQSESNTVSCVVPQGSVLGPLLFLLHVNDMHRAVGKGLIRNLYVWCVQNKLTINSEKTCFMIFHVKNTRIPLNIVVLEIPDIDVNMQRSRSCKYLGVIVDECLSWQDHVSHVTNSLLKYFGIFNRLITFVSMKIARQLYFAFVFSRIKCRIEVYGNCSDTLCSKLQTMQNKLLKLLLHLDFFFFSSNTS